MPRQARSWRSSSCSPVAGRSGAVVVDSTRVAMGTTFLACATTVPATSASRGDSLMVACAITCYIVAHASSLASTDAAASHPQEERTMALEGLHHITAITGVAPRNVDFYARLLGLRLVKKTVNFDQPDVYHLYFGDERGAPGSILTFFEFPLAKPGRPGDGMVHTIQWRVASDAALDFWAARLGDAEVATERDGDALRFEDFEGL